MLTEQEYVAKLINEKRQMSKKAFVEEYRSFDELTEDEQNVIIELKKIRDEMEKELDAITSKYKPLIDEYNIKVKEMKREVDDFNSKLDEYNPKEVEEMQRKIDDFSSNWKLKLKDYYKERDNVDKKCKKLLKNF